MSARIVRLRCLANNRPCSSSAERAAGVCDCCHAVSQLSKSRSEVLAGSVSVALIADCCVCAGCVACGYVCSEHAHIFMFCWLLVGVNQKASAVVITIATRIRRRGDFIELKISTIFIASNEICEQAFFVQNYASSEWLGRYNWARRRCFASSCFSSRLWCPSQCVMACTMRPWANDPSPTDCSALG